MEKYINLEALIDDYLNLEEGRIYIEKGDKSVINTPFCVVPFDEEVSAKDYLIYMKTSVFKEIVEEEWDTYKQSGIKYGYEPTSAYIASSLVWMSDHVRHYSIYNMGELREEDLFDLYIFARYKGQWIFFNNHPSDEDPDACYILSADVEEKPYIETAEQTLKESGLIPSKIIPAFDYYYTDDRSGVITEAGGHILYAEIETIENATDNMVLSDDLPKDLTFTKFTEMMFNRMIEQIDKK